MPSYGCLIAPLVVLAFLSPAVAEVVGVYTEAGSIVRLVDGAIVPSDPANRDYQAMMQAVANGDTIAPYESPVLGPTDYPLQRYQFLALLDIAGLKPMVETAIDSIEDPVERAVARAKYEATDIFHRNDPLLVQLAAAAGLTPEQVDAYWMLAKDL